MNLATADFPSANSTGAPYVAGNFGPLKSEVTAIDLQVIGHIPEELTGRFGPRDASLDGKQIDEQVVRSGLRLMLLLSAGALLSVGFVVVTALAGLRAVKRARASG